MENSKHKQSNHSSLSHPHHTFNNDQHFALLASSITSSSFNPPLQFLNSTFFRLNLHTLKYTNLNCTILKMTGVIHDLI